MGGGRFENQIVGHVHALMVMIERPIGPVAAVQGVDVAPGTKWHVVDEVDEPLNVVVREVRTDLHARSAGKYLCSGPLDGMEPGGELRFEFAGDHVHVNIDETIGINSLERST